MPDLAAVGVFGYRILPYLFAIWLVMMSDFVSGYLKSLVDQYIDRKKPALEKAAAKESQRWTNWNEDVLESERVFVKDLVSDCVLRANFLNAMLATLVSVVAATSAARSFTWLTFGLMFLVAAYVPLLYFLVKLGPAGLVAPALHFEFWGKPRTISDAPYLVYRKVLIAMNIVLIAITGLSQAYPAGIRLW